MPLRLRSYRSATLTISVCALDKCFVRRDFARKVLTMARYMGALESLCQYQKV